MEPLMGQRFTVWLGRRRQILCFESAAEIDRIQLQAGVGSGAAAMIKSQSCLPFTVNTGDASTTDRIGRKRDG